MVNFRPLPAFLPRIIGALLLVLLTGCSAIRLGYNNAASLTYWWLDGYIDFTDAQAQPVRDRLAALHAWHRQRELPALADLLQQMQTLAAGDVTPQQVCALTDPIRQHLRRLAAQVAESMAPIVPTLRPEQLEHLAEQFEKHNQTWREEWLDGTAAELQERRLERTIDRYESFYGRLSDAQQALLRQRIAASSYDPRLAWAERLRRQRDMLRVFQEHRGGERPAHVQAELLALLQRSLEPPEPEYRQQFESTLQEGCQTLAALHNSASPAQRRQLIERLRAYESTFRALAAEK